MFCKSWMYLCALVAVLANVVIGQTMMLTNHELANYFGEALRGISVMGFVFLLLLGFANYLGSRFTLPKEYDHITQHMPIYFIMWGGIICGAAIVGAILLGSRSPWILWEIGLGLAMIIMLSLAGSFLRGMADDDRVQAELRQREG